MRRGEILRGPVLRGSVYAGVLVWVNAYICRDWLYHPTAEMNSLHGYWAAIARLAEGWLHPAWWPFWDFGIPFEFTSPPMVPALAALIADGRQVPHLMAVQFVSAIFYCAAPAALFLLAWGLTRAPESSFFAGLFYSLLSPAQILAPDGPFSWAEFPGPHRFMLQAVWDETPRCAALTFLLLFLLFLARAIEKGRLADSAWAAILLALAMLASPFAALSAMLATLCLVVVRRANPIRVAGIGVLAYALVARFLPPSMWLAMGAASAAHEPWRFNAVTVIAGVAVVWLTLMHALRRWTEDWRLGFFVLLAFAMSCGPMLVVWMDRQILPQATRFRLEMEAAVALAVVFGLRAGLVRLPRSIRVLTALAMVALAIPQVIQHRKRAKAVLVPADVTATIEYSTAQRVARDLAGRRVMLPGSIARWANAFTDLPQFSGSEGTAAYSQLQQIAMTSVYEGDARASLATLKAYGAAAVAVPGADSREYWKPFTQPAKFEGLLPLLWSEDGVRVYRVPQRSGSLAHVVPESALGNLDRYHAALDDPAMPEAAFEWHGRNRVRIHASTAPGQVVSIQVSYHPGWHAMLNGRPVKLQRDGLGLMWLRPEEPGPATIEMDYDGGWELRLCRWLSVAGILAVGYCLVRSVVAAGGADG